MAKSFNPFSIFRKNQKVALAFITLLSMFAFVCVAPSMMGMGNNPAANPKAAAVAKWNYGDITHIDIEGRLRARNQINRFLRNIWAEAAQLGKVDPATTAPPQFSPLNEDGVLKAIVLEKKAELLGMSVSDDYVNQYIDAVSNGALSREKKDELLHQVTGNQRGAASQVADQFFENMRFELLAQNFYRLLTHDAIDYDTPEQRWNNFSRLYRQATVQVLPVAVKDFTSKVGDPDNGELQVLFDKNKDRLPQPEFPDPGFKVPAKAKFQYFKAVRETLAKADEAKVTDAEINDYYEKHKERFRKLSPLDESAPKSETPKANEAPTATPKSAPKSAPATGKPNAESTTEKPKPAAASPTAPATTPANPPPSAPPAPSTPKTGAVKPDAAPKSPANKSSLIRRLRHSGDEELLALADTAPPAATPPASKSATAKSTPPAAAPASAPAANAAAKSPPAAAGSSAAKPGDQVSDGVTSAEIKSLTDDTSPKPAASKTNPQAPASEYDPVTDPKVRKTIREELARDKASGQIKEAFQKLKAEVGHYNMQYTRWAGAGSEGTPPQEPDFKASAKIYGMTFEQTGSLSAEEAAEKNELGKSVHLEETPELRLVPFSAMAFDPNLSLYRTNDTDSGDDELSFLWWKTDFQPAYVPNFSDAKPEVVKAWKMIQARKLAQKEAQAHADEANRRRATLKEIFQNRANMTVSEVGPFHWLTVSNVQSGRPQRPQISLTRLTGVDMAGEAFMEATFKTEVGSATSAFNQPQTIAYVIQLQKLDPPEDSFRNAFQRYEIQMFNSQKLGAPYGAADLFANTVRDAKIRSIYAELGFQRVAPAEPTSGTSAANESDDSGPPSDDEP